MLLAARFILALLAPFGASLLDTGSQYVALCVEPRRARVRRSWATSEHKGAATDPAASTPHLMAPILRRG